MGGISSRQMKSVSLGKQPGDPVLDRSSGRVLFATGPSMGVLDLRSAKVSGKVRIGRVPSDPVIDDGSGRVLVTSDKDRKLVVTDLSSLTELGSLDLPKSPGPPTVMAAVQTILVFTGETPDESTLYLIDADTLTIRNEVSGLGTSFDAFLHPQRRQLYLVSHWGDLMVVLDLEPLAFAATVEMRPGPDFVSFSKDGSKAYVKNRNYHLLEVVDLADFSVLGHLETGQYPHPPVGIDGGGKLLVSSFGDGTCRFIDTDRVEVLDTIQVADRLGRPTIDHRSGRAYMTSADGLACIDLVGRTCIGVAGNQEGGGLNLAPVLDGHGGVHCILGEELVSFDAQSLDVIERVHVGALVCGVLWDEQTSTVVAFDRDSGTAVLVALSKA